MNSQPTYGAALVVVNEAKAWDWSCRPNRKAEHVKLDLAAHRANRAGVPRCRSFRGYDDKVWLNWKVLVTVLQSIEASIVAVV